jgi:CubicO group peptidase (beta-lactamase class C family)
LRDTIGRFVPQLPVRWRGVTVEQLLEHTSGVPDYTAIGDRWTRAWKDSVTPQALIALVNGAKGELDFRPGTDWSYSNMGYDVLGLLVETLYAKPFADVIRDEFAVPLGLGATRFCENAAGANGQALGYARTGARFETAPYQHISHAFADGSLCTTVGDLDRWNRALHGGRVVSAASYARMITPAGSAVQANYGLGVKAIARPEHPIIYHQGQMPGFVSIDAWFPGDSLSVVVLANDDAWPGLVPLLNALAPIALGIPL